MVSKALGANLQTLAREKPVVQEGEGQRVCGVGRSHPPALVASGAVSSSVFVPAVLSSGARCATLTRPKEGKKGAQRSTTETILCAAVLYLMNKEQFVSNSPLS